MAQDLTLYHYWRSTSSWRVRWALAYKKIPCQFVAINLLENEQQSAEFLLINPMGTVPALRKDGKVITESVAMMEWLEETYPQNPILPADLWARARVRQLTEIICSATQPLQNLIVQKEIENITKSESVKKQWTQKWIRRGLQTYENFLQQKSLEGPGRFSVGNSLSMADFSLIPQCYNADRFEVALHDFPLIRKIRENAMQESSYALAEPEKFKP